MPRPARHILAVGTLALLLAAPAAGQVAPLSPVWRPHLVTLTVLGGGAAYSDFLTVDTPTGLDERLTARTSLVVGAALAYWPRRGWGVRVQGSWTPTRFERERSQASPDGGARDGRGADLVVWTVSADLLVRLPLELGRVAPYAVVGGGAVRYASPDDAAALPPEAREAFAAGSRSRAALAVGVGALVPLQREGLLLTFELTDHVVRSPLDAPADGSTAVTSNVRLLVGLTLPLAWARTS